MKFFIVVKTNVENKPWEYSINKYNDERFEIEIPISGSGCGVSAFYILTAVEKEEYLKVGIEALTERIKDMRKNSAKYKLVSWR